MGGVFYTKLGTVVADVPAQCDAFIAVRRPGGDNPFPPITLIQSVKMWQQSYFYVKSIFAERDWVNLPAYVAGPLAGRRPN